METNFRTMIKNIAGLVSYNWVELESITLCYTDCTVYSVTYWLLIGSDGLCCRDSPG